MDTRTLLRERLRRSRDWAATIDELEKELEAGEVREVTMHDGSVLGVGGGACGTSTALPDLDFLPGKPIQ